MPLVQAQFALADVLLAVGSNRWPARAAARAQRWYRLLRSTPLSTRLGARGQHRITDNTDGARGIRTRNVLALVIGSQTHMKFEMDVDLLVL